jgi:phage tail sheath gpL-like
MANNYFSVRYNMGNDSRSPVASNDDTQGVLQRLEHFNRMLKVGATTGAPTVTAYAAEAAASGTVTISSGSGSITATINGVAIAVTWATSDTATATALAAAINASANALVSKHVTASSAAGVVTITSSRPGYAGNAVTLAASGTGATANVSRLAGGTATEVTYSI